MASELSAAARGGAKGATLPASNHPQRLHIHRLEKPAPTLEAWLDAGVFGCEDEEGDETVKGHKRLPTGYEGCSKGNVLVEAVKPNIWVWPARLDLGEHVEGTKSWTLYHYTHAASFGAFAKMLSARQEVNAEELAGMVFEHLMDDFLERDYSPDLAHSKPMLKLLSVEPGMFRSKKEIRKVLFGGQNRHGVSDKGNHFEDFADYCIPVRVPGSACRLESGKEHAERLTVLINKEVLDALHEKAEAKATLVQVKRERAMRSMTRMLVPEPSSWGCLGFFFGGHGHQTHDDRDEDFAERKKELAAGRDVVNRPRREVGHRQTQMRKMWMKEHFASIKQADDKEERRKQAEQRKSPEGNAAIAKVPVASPKAKVALKMEGRKFDGEAPSFGKRLTVIGSKAAQLLADDKDEEDPVSAHVTKMYRDFQEKTESHKEVARGSLVRMKTRRSDRGSMVMIDGLALS